MKNEKNTQADNYESEKDTLSRDLRDTNNASLTSKLDSESYSSPDSESGTERDSEKDLISDSESIIMIITVIVVKADFKDRLYILREIIMRKKALNFINKVRRSNNLQYLA